MDAKNKNIFEPSSDLIHEEDCNTLLLYLPGFTKEQLRVQLTRSRVLKISGARPIGDNKLSSFQKDFPVPENCDTNRISAKFEDGILYVRQPKLIVPADKDDKKIILTSEKPQPQKPAEAPPSPRIDQRSQETTKKTTTSNDDHVEQTRVKDLPEKSIEKKEEKSTKENEKISELLEGSKKDEGKYVAEKTGGIEDDDKKVAAARIGSDKRKKTPGTAGGIEDDDKKVAAARIGSDKRKIIPGTAVDDIAQVTDYSKMNAAAKLKLAREKVTTILLLLFAFTLGMYVSSLPWFSRKAEN